VITATNRFVVEPIIRSLGIDEFLATEPEQINGRITGNIVGTPTFQQGKVTALYHWLENQQQTMNGSYFYSDSINDLPLLLMVDNPVAVDPDPSLRAEAEQRNWEIISLRN
jgi:HAD superfamily hydrolase (TIGR01490 family)